MKKEDEELLARLKAASREHDELYQDVLVGFMLGSVHLKNNTFRRLFKGADISTAMCGAYIELSTVYDGVKYFALFPPALVTPTIDVQAIMEPTFKEVTYPTIQE